MTVALETNTPLQDVDDHAIRAHLQSILNNGQLNYEDICTAVQQVHLRPATHCNEARRSLITDLVQACNRFGPTVLHHGPNLPKRNSGGRC